MKESRTSILKRSSVPEGAALGCFSAPVLVLLSLPLMLVWDGDVTTWLLTVSSSVVVMSLLPVSWRGLKRLRQQAYVALPGRRSRDLSRVLAWAVDNRFLFGEETLGVGEFAGYQLSPMAGQHPVDHGFSHEDANFLFICEQIERCTLLMQVQPHEDGYAISMRISLPEAWRHLLRACVGSQTALLGGWRKSLQLGRAGHGNVRPFVWSSLIARKRPDYLVSLDDPEQRWLALYEEVWLEWVLKRAHWDSHGALVVLVQGRQDELETQLAKLLSMSKTLQQTLAQFYRPFLPQCLDVVNRSMSDRLFEHEWHEKSSQWMHDRQECYELCWWIYLANKHGADRRLRAILPALWMFWAKSKLLQFLQTINKDVREKFMLPSLAGFMRGECILQRQTKDGFAPPLGSIEGIPLARFRIWFGVLKESMSREPLLAYCASIVARPPTLPDVDTLQRDLHKLVSSALECWLTLAEDKAQTQLLTWLDDVDESFKKYIVRAFCFIEAIDPSVEERVIPLVFHENITLRLVTIGLLEKIGTYASIQVLQSGIDLWDAKLEKQSIAAAMKALEVLRDGLPQGALSTFDEFEEDAEGQVSLVSDEEGKLSVMGSHAAGDGKLSIGDGEEDEEERESVEKV